jgi:hypothetical protein
VSSSASHLTHALAFKASDYRRAYSPSEKMWAALNNGTAFYNQMVIDYPELPSDIDWHAVAKKVVDANPGCAIKPRSMLAWRYWQGHGRVFALQYKTFDGSLMAALQTLPQNLDDAKGCVCDLWVITHAQGVALVFRSTHTSMDGRGTLHWAEETMRAIRGEELLGTNNQQSDLEFSAEITTKQREPISTTDCQPLTAGMAIMPKRFFVIQVNARARDLTPKLLVSLRRYAALQGCEQFRVMIPTDLRSYKKSVCSTANLTGCLDLDVSIDATAESLGMYLVMQLYKKTDAIFTTVQHSLHWVPEFLIRWVSRTIAKRCAKENRYSHNTNVSNIGDLKHDRFVVNHVSPSNAFFVAPSSQIFPLFICLAGLNDKTTITFSIPEHLQANADALMTYLCAELDGECLV